jgi:hypothetical protein
LYKRFSSDLLLTLFFLAVFFINLVHHEMWRDELNVYGIAHASPTFASLVWHVHHEGHPLIWYLIVWLGSKALPSVFVLKALQGIIGAAIILMIGLVSPFSRLERVLLLLSYFVLFEYTVLSRMYGLFLLMAMAFVWRRIYHPDGYLVNALLLGLLANTDVIGLIFSGAFGLEYAVNRYRECPDKDVVRRHLAKAALIYIALVACCYMTISPPADISWRTTGKIFRHGFQFTHFASVYVEYLALPWFPLRHSEEDPLAHYWNPIAFDHRTLYPLLFLSVLASYFFTFRRDRDLLATFAIASLGGATFGFFFYTGSMRTWGITFVAYVSALWLQRFRRPGTPVSSTILLTLCAISGVVFNVLMWTHPFSSSEATAEWLISQHLQNAAIVGTPDTSVSAVAILLKRPIYYLDCQCSDDYMLFSNRRDSYDVRNLSPYTMQAFDRLHSSELILLLISPIEPGDKSEIESRGARVKLLAKFTGAEAPDEDFYIYRVSRTQLAFRVSQQ